MMTEKEAKTKWCPRRWVHTSETDMNCIGSACMAWRWDGPVVAWGDGTHRHPHHGAAAKGYCGLAGKP